MNRTLALVAALTVAAVTVISSRPPTAMAASPDGSGRWAVIPVTSGSANNSSAYAILLDTTTGDTWTNVNAAGTWAKMSR